METPLEVIGTILGGLFDAVTLLGTLGGLLLYIVIWQWFARREMALQSTGQEKAEIHPFLNSKQTQQFTDATIDRFGRLETQMSEFRERLARLEESRKVYEDRIDTRLEQMESRFEKALQRWEQLQSVPKETSEK